MTFQEKNFMTMLKQSMKWLLLAVLLALPPCLWAQTGFSRDLPRSTPAQEGVEAQALVEFMDSLLNVPETEIHHVMVLRHGKVIAELHPSPFAAGQLHTLYSASKTFVSMAIGFAIDENRLRLTDRVVGFFPEKLPDSIGDNLAQMTVRDVLMMASGIVPDWEMRNVADDWVSTWLAKPVAEPGKRFKYDSMCTFMLSAIVQQVTGMTTFDYLQKKLFAPLNITCIDWEQSPDGMSTGGWGLRLHAEDEAKLGVLLLNKGRWNGRQLISEQWIEQASSKQIDCAEVTTPPTDGNQGYGYQLWRSKRPGSFRADGAWGQYIVMLPDLDVVVVINGMSARGHAELACIWNQLVPGIHDGVIAHDKGAKKLRQLCTRAALPTLKGHKKSKGQRSGKFSMALGNGEKLHLDLGENHGVLSLYKGEVLTDSVPLGYGRWEQLHSSLIPPYSISARNRLENMSQGFSRAGCMAWTAPHELTIQVKYINLINTRTIVVNFKGSQAHVTVIDDYDKSHPGIFRNVNVLERR